MREILFRGQLLFCKSWIEGQYCKTNYSFKENCDKHFDYVHHWIIEEKIPNKPILYEVKENTVGQYTGITDKNGTKIFEGDILKWDEIEWGCSHNEIVAWDYSLLSMRLNDWHEWCEIIGNIWDNPELIEDKKPTQNAIGWEGI